MTNLSIADKFFSCFSKKKAYYKSVDKAKLRVIGGRKATGPRLPGMAGLPNLEGEPDSRRRGDPVFLF